MIGNQLSRVHFIMIEFFIVGIESPSQQSAFQNRKPLWMLCSCIALSFQEERHKTAPLVAMYLQYCYYEVLFYAQNALKAHQMRSPQKEIYCSSMRENFTWDNHTRTVDLIAKCNSRTSTSVYVFSSVLLNDSRLNLLLTLE